MQGVGPGIKTSSLPFHQHGAPALLSPPATSNSPDLPLLLRTATRARPQKLLIGLIASTLVLYALLRGSVPVPRLASYRAGSTTPRTLLAEDGTALTTFLDSHFPRPGSSRSPAPHIWLTLSDAYWARTGVLALQTFTERLNTEREASGRSKDGRQTKLVVLCLDEECMQVAQDKNMYAYGGFMFSRPPKILRATWPKLASLIEILQTRDVFFVDADVSFKYDPYPLMEPYMKTHDLIAQENDSFDHFNTGWMWIKQSKEASDAWNEVLKMDLENTSRDQNNFNKVLHTTAARHCTEDCLHPGSRLPLKNDFVASNGMRVRILEPAKFRSHHFEADMPYVERHESISFHMTCGDDAQIKVYMAKSQGFWGDVDRYFDSPPQMVTIDHLSGTRDELTHLMRILTMAAYHTHRAILPPQIATFTDFNETNEKGEMTRPTRKIYSAFPVSHIEQSMGVHVVEPLYPSYATQWLQGGSVLELGATRHDQGWSDNDEAERAKLALSLHETADLDLRHVDSFPELLQLMTSPSFSSRRIVRLVNHNYPSHMKGAPNWRRWPTEGAVSGLRPCHNVEFDPICERICRFDGPSTIVMSEPWMSSDQILDSHGPLHVLDNRRR